MKNEPLFMLSNAVLEIHDVHIHGTSVVSLVSLWQLTCTLYVPVHVMHVFQTFRILGVSFLLAGWGLGILRTLLEVSMQMGIWLYNVLVILYSFGEWCLCWPENYGTSLYSTCNVVYFKYMYIIIFFFWAGDRDSRSSCSSQYMHMTVLCNIVHEPYGLRYMTHTSLWLNHVHVHVHIMYYY